MKAEGPWQYYQLIDCGHYLAESEGQIVKTDCNMKSKVSYLNLMTSHYSFRSEMDT